MEIQATTKWTAIPKGTRARRVGALHGVGNVLVTGLFVVSWAIRVGDPARLPRGAFVLSLIGVLLALITGWLGGELVDRLGVGVDPGAHVDAPSSLSGRPASERWTEPRPPRAAARVSAAHASVAASLPGAPRGAANLGAPEPIHVLSDPNRRRFRMTVIPRGADWIEPVLGLWHSCPASVRRELQHPLSPLDATLRGRRRPAPAGRRW